MYRTNLSSDGKQIWSESESEIGLLVLGDRRSVGKGAGNVEYYSCLDMLVFVLTSNFRSLFMGKGIF